MTQVFNLASGVGAKIKEAADEQKVIQITYLDAKDRPSIRTIEPYEIKDGKLFAHCLAKNSIRAFKTERIQSAEVQLIEFAPRHPILI